MRRVLYPLCYSIFIVCLLVLPSRNLLAFDHTLYDEILKKYVHGESVDFQELSKDLLLDEYLNSYQSISWDELSSLSREDQLAFWINACNALTLKSRIDSQSKIPVKLTLKDRSFSLKEIRDEILRRRFRDERIHFAVITSSTNGPELRPEAYVGTRLDQQLDEQIRKFLSDKSKNLIEPKQKKVVLSYLFKDFGDDFLLNYPPYENPHSKFTLSQMAVLSFIAQHSSPDIVKYLSEAKYKIQYFPNDPDIPASQGASKGHLN